MFIFFLLFLLLEYIADIIMLQYRDKCGFVPQGYHVHLVLLGTRWGGGNGDYTRLVHFLDLFFLCLSSSLFIQPGVNYKCMASLTQ